MLYNKLFLVLSLLLLSFNLSANEIQTATKAGDISTITQLLKENPKAWLTGQKYSWDTPPVVTEAIKQGNLAILQLFVAHGYNPVISDWLGSPLLLISPAEETASPKHINMLRWLLEQESKLEGEYESVLLGTMLDSFVTADHITGAKALLEHGANPNEIITYSWYSALDLSESEEMSELLKSYGANSYLLKKSIIILAVSLLLIFSFIRWKKHLKPGSNRKLLYFYWVIIITIGIVLLLTGPIIVRGLNSQLGTIASYLIGLLFFKILPIVVMIRATHLIKKARQLRPQNVNDILKKDKRKPILYLRSFQNDGTYRKRKWWYWLLLWFSPWMSFLPRSTHEEELTTKLAKYGQVIAIGDPEEELPKLGALRLYVSHDTWKQTVLTLMQQSQLVILRIGLTEGILWELKNSIKELDSNQFVIWLVQGENEPKDQSNILAQHLHKNSTDIFPQTIPLEICQNEFIYFKNNWEPKGTDKLDTALNNLNIIKK